VEHPGDLDALLCVAVVDQIFAHWKATQIGLDFIARPACHWIFA